MERPKVKVKFKYNFETGEVEEFIIDDNKPDASQEYHDIVADSIAKTVCLNPEIKDAGNIRLSGKKEIIKNDFVNHENNQNRRLNCNKT